MPDLLAATRSLPQGSSVEGQRALATAFGASEEIRPATGAVAPPPARAMGPTPGGATPGYVTPGRATSGHATSGRATPGSATPSGAASDSATPYITPGGATPYVTSGGAAPYAASGGGVRPDPAGWGSNRPAAQRATGRTLMPAPPPISIRRTQRSAAPAKPARTPAPVRSGAAALVPGPGGVLRRSLVETTADLFADDAATTDYLSHGFEMSPAEQSTLRVVSTHGQSRVGTANPETAQPDPAEALLANPRRLHELVDAIVDRIERRVVDELERRGRRQSFGAF